MRGPHSSQSLPSSKPLKFDEYPAKTYLKEDGTTVIGRTVVDHCQIVGEVARQLIARYPFVLRRELFPTDAEFAAAAHDIGKISPYFAEKIRRACTGSRPTLPGLAAIDPALEKTWGGHAGVSQLTAKALDAPKWIPEILGQHHGFSPPVAGYRVNDEIFGGESWQREREALVVELQARLGADWPQVPSIPVARVLAGLASVSDWVGSGKFFENPDLPWRDRVATALDDAGFIPPTCRPGLSFHQVFGITPRNIQQQLVEAVTSPGVYVLEAPMGMGKTEAALYAAYRRLESGEATGIYFALPTQLTSNRIHERFSAFLRCILTDDSQLRPLLLHANAWLLGTEMGEEGRPGGAWFNHAKRGLLAPFAVGTIDQALMAAMNVKHGFVRAFGLAGKVVILDEVHTYDAYTGTLLDALVRLLRDLHCTVIILSATLTRDRRQKLLGYKLASAAYPLITALPRQQNPQELYVPASDRQAALVRLLAQEESAINEALERASLGQQVLWIENTVGEAQERYLDLAARAAELGVACGLLHSRFTVDDRRRIEDRWVSLFGKPGWNERQDQGRILIGTQVLEQSLDIDADFLVSRFAPSDMLLQRLGRLWRHADTPRAESAVCETWLLAPDLERAIANPKLAFGNSAFVYSPYVLCRSLEVWVRKGALDLPQDIRSLIEQTYAERHEDGAMARWLDELENGTRWRKGRQALAQLARVTLAQDGNTLPEGKAQTRYSESDGHEVLLLRGLHHAPQECASLLTLLNGEQLRLPWQRHVLTKPQWRQLTATLMRQIVHVHDYDAPEAVSTTNLKNFGFQNCFYLGQDDWADDESLLRIALVDEAGALQGIQGVRVHEKYPLDYRDDLGYRVIKS